MDAHRDVNLDLLRVISAYMVVTLHIAAQGFYAFNPYWEIALVYNVLSRVAVPIMFMISGALLIPKQEPLKGTALRFIKRALVPYIVWSVIYMLYSAWFTGSLFHITNIFHHAPYYHLWFLFQYFGFLLALPLLRGFWGNSPKTAKLYVIAASLGYGTVVDFIHPWIGKSIIGFPISIVPYYIGYGLLGAYLYQRERVEKTVTPALLTGFFMCSAATFVLTWQKSLRAGAPTELFLVYSSFFTMIVASCFFQWALSIHVPAKIGSRLTRVASATFGVYLLHPLIISSLSAFLVWDTFHPAGWIPIFSICVSGSCCLFFLVLRSAQDVVAKRLKGHASQKLQ